MLTENKNKIHGNAQEHMFTQIEIDVKLRSRLKHKSIYTISFFGVIVSFLLDE